jgi:2-polyprenyl-3-methyl-5-hydroxy-6-metoxy-1,4-benzoquinol methylase
MVADYYQKQRHEMMAYIPLEVKRTLEIGCGAGGFSMQIQSRSSAESWGVEYEPEAARLAAQKLHRVLAGSVEDALPQLPTQYFDCIIFNDVLEHLVDPYRVLASVQPLLNDQGVVVASIPNIRHWPEFVDFTLHGNWEYRRDGVLDRTHLRFFTKKSMLSTFTQCGYEVIKIEGINPYYSRAQKIASLLSLRALEDTLYLQYAVVARPLPQTKA